MSEENQSSEKDEEKKDEQSPSLVSILKQYPSAPSQEQIEQWKVLHGDLFVSGFSETELYVFRALKRKDWIELQVIASKPENKVDEYRFQELVCDRVLLWKSVDVSWADGKGGTPTTLQEQILQNSNFMSPQAASCLVCKL
jgi:hypothetical protein